MRFFKNLALWKQVTIGLVAGIIVGVIFGQKAAALYPIGDIFMRLIRMIIVPLIFVSVVVGITSVSDKESLSRLTIKALLAFFSTTFIAVSIGLTVATLIKPGAGIDPSVLGSATRSATATSGIDLVKIIHDTIPDNALNALVSGKMLQVVFFSFFTGAVINSLGSKKTTIVAGVKLAAQIVFKMIGLILRLAPYGTFALTASVVGQHGVGALNHLGMLALCLVIAVSIQYSFFGLLILTIGKMSPIPFYKKSLEYQSLAFSTSSSKATLPTTMYVCSEKLGVSKSSTSFILPLGAAINMDGMSIYLAICTLFFAQIYGIDLTVVEYVIVLLAATLGSIGAAGVPSGTIIMLPMVLGSINLPIEGIALIVGIDRILDMIRTTLNITGDAVVTMLIDRSEGTFNEKMYYTASNKLDKRNSTGVQDSF